jgi:ParB family chromosome partitioning protein
MNSEFRMVRRDQLSESPLNPRQRYDEQKLQELADSIRQQGILTPLLVRPLATAAGCYEIGAGHRRFRAAALAGVEQIPVIVRAMDDTAFLELLTIENLQREDVHPLEEVQGYRTLLREARYDVKDLATKIGKSLSYVYQRLKLLDLIAPAQEYFLAGELTPSHAILLARLQPTEQARVLEECQDTEWHGGKPERIGFCSVREMARYIEHHIHLDLHAAPFSAKDETLLPAAGSCQACPKRTGFLPELFPDIAKKDTCTDPACFNAKLDAHIARKKNELTEPFLELDSNYDYSKRRKDEDPLPRNAWTRIERKTDRCAHAQPGLIVAGRERGSVIDVCAEPACAKHYPFSNERHDEQWKAEEERRKEKQRRQAETRRRLFGAIRGKVTAPLPRPVLDLVLAEIWKKTWRDTQKRLAKLYAWETKGHKIDLNAYGTEQIRRMTEDELARFLVDLVLTPALHVSTWGPDTAEVLSQMAQLYGVEGLGRKKSSEKATRKKYLAQLPDLRVCQVCGCTDADGCENGCYWVKPDLCSTCVDAPVEAEEAV